MPRALWLLVIGMAVNSTGNSFLWPLNTIYIHDQLGKSLTIAGLVLMLNNGASVIGNLLGGSLFDKIGGYKAVLVGIFITLFALIGLSIWHEWPEYVVFLMIVGFGSGIIFPAVYAMAGTVWPEGGRKPFNALYVAQNVGVAIGSALGGIVADYSFQSIFLANAIMFIIFFFITAFGYRGMAAGVRGEAQAKLGFSTVKGNKNLRALFVLCIGYMLCWGAYVQWSTTISSYTHEMGISLAKYSLLWTINGGLIVLGQPVIQGIIKHLVSSLKRQMLIGIGIFIVSFFVAGSSHAFSGFIAGMVILTIGEMFVWPAVPTAAFALAPKGREGLFQGIVNSTATGGRMLGPLLGGILIDHFGMTALFLAAIVLFLISVITTIFYDRGLVVSGTVRGQNG